MKKDQPKQKSRAPSGSSNSFSALAAYEDADALQEEVAASQHDGRRQGGSKDGTAESTGEKAGLKQPLVWIDLEMTGLDVERDTILQIAVIITDGNLGGMIEGPEITIHHGEGVLEGMNDWCKENHGRSGLTQAVRDSSVSLEEAEQRVLEFVQERVPEPGVAQVAGNSVHVDVAFLKRHMPRLAQHFHYRIVDVSTISELCRRWFPKENMRAPKKKNAHTAMADIRESIAQLEYYRHSIFKKWAGLHAPQRR